MSVVNLKIVTPEKIFLETSCDMVVAPGSEGEFGVLFNHVPLLSNLGEGVVKIYNKEEVSKEVKISSGVCHVKDNQVIILAESCC